MNAITLKFRSSWYMTLFSWHVLDHRLGENNYNLCNDTELHLALRFPKDQKEKDKWFESQAKDINKQFLARTAQPVSSLSPEGNFEEQRHRR